MGTAGKPKALARLFALASLIVAGVAPAQGPSPTALAPSAGPSAVATTPTTYPGGGQPLTRDNVTAWLDGYVPYALKSGDIAGAVVMVVRGNQVIAARGYGYANIAKKRPVDPARTLFRPGSISKLVTWTAVMQQVEAGRIDLDADVNKYLDFRIPPRNGQPVTMRQIMTHTGGFEEVGRDVIFYDPKLDKPLGDYIKQWVPTRVYDAGTTPAYSNWATAVAGYIVQRVSGLPFETYVEQRIFRPLDMRTASFRQPLPKQLQPLMATGYARASSPAKGFEYVGPAPAGALSASGLDMAKFMMAHLNDGAGILRPRTAAMMHDSPLDRINPLSLMPPLNRMELGFFESNINGREVIGHLGDTYDFHSALHLFLKENVGLFVSFNSPGRDGAAGPLRTQLYEDFADRYFPATLLDSPADAKTAAEHARRMAGTWESSRRSIDNFFNLASLLGQTEVATGTKGELVIPSLKGTNGAVRQWEEIAPFVWRERGGHERVAAKLIGGEVARWTFGTVAAVMVYERVPGWRSATWLMPALYASLAVLLLSFLYWPAAWLIRRRYQATMPIAGAGLKAYRALRIVTVLALAVLAGWAMVISALADNSGTAAGVADGWLWLLQIGGAVVFVGALGIAAWNLWLTWRDGRGWASRLWSVVILLATIVVLWTAWAYGLLAMTVNY